MKKKNYPKGILNVDKIHTKVSSKSPCEWLSWGKEQIPLAVSLVMNQIRPLTEVFTVLQSNSAFALNALSAPNNAHKALTFDADTFLGRSLQSAQTPAS